MTPFTEERLAAAIRALPADVPAGTSELLAELLPVWWTEELPEHLNRPTRADLRRRKKKLASLQRKAKELYDEVT
jgi:hypothetical protein